MVAADRVVNGLPLAPSWWTTEQLAGEPEHKKVGVGR